MTAPFASPPTLNEGSLSPYLLQHLLSVIFLTLFLKANIKSEVGLQVVVIAGKDLWKCSFVFVWIKKLGEGVCMYMYGCVHAIAHRLQDNM